MRSSLAFASALLYPASKQVRSFGSLVRAAWVAALRAFDQHIKPGLRRAGLFGFAVIMLIIAVMFAYPEIRDQETYMANFWPLWFAATAGMLFLFACKPWHYQLWRWCGFFLIPATGSRIGGVIVRWLTTDTLEWQRAVAGVCTYVVLTGVLLSWWFEVVRPWRAHRAVERMERQGFGSPLDP